MEIELHLINEAQFQALTESVTVEEFATTARNDQSFETTEILMDPYPSPLFNIADGIEKSKIEKSDEGLSLLSRNKSTSWDNCGIIKNIITPDEAKIILESVNNPPDLSGISRDQKELEYYLRYLKEWTAVLSKSSNEGLLLLLTYNEW